MHEAWHSEVGVTPDGAGGVRLEAVVPAGSRYFEGHFPGRPVVPGVAMLGLVGRAVAALPGRGGTPAVDGLRRVRFRRLVEAGGRFEVSVGPGRGDRADEATFQVRWEGQDVAGGHVRIAPENNDELSTLTPCPHQDTPHPLSDRILDAVPHGRPMLLLDRVLHVDDERCTCGATVSERWPLLGPGGAGPVVLVELVAQTATARFAWETLATAGGPHLGFLVGVARARWTAAPLPVGASARISIRTESRLDNYATYRGEVHLPGRPAAEVVIQAIRPRD